jgi:uncharacterized membrane protein (DUF373 family)
VDKIQTPSTEKILRWSRMGKRLIAGILMVLMFGLVGVVTVEILIAFAQAILPGPTQAFSAIVMSEAQMLEVLGLFLTVLIALELIETVEVYFRKHSIHVEIVVLVATIALARKVILLDLSKYSAATLFALAALITALGVTYFLVRKASPADEE